MKLVVNLKVTKIYQERLTFSNELPDVVVHSTYVGHCHSGDNLVDCKKLEMNKCDLLSMPKKTKVFH